MNKIIWFICIVGVLAVSGLLYLSSQPKEEVYDPEIRPEEFSANITNPYFTLEPGTQFVYEAKKPEGTERIEITVLNETKDVALGVTARVVRDQVFLDGELIEDTWDWYAEDGAGNVWYMGEKTAEYENGVVVTTAGSWEAGVDGAKPGYIMKANPKVGDSYWQEYYQGEAEDRADVLALGEHLTVPYGTFDDCVKTYDYTPLDPKAKEHKYYCKGVGFVALEINLEDNERTELISLVSGGGAAPAPSPNPPSATPPAVNPPPAQGSTPASEITEAEARSIALARVPGTVTDVVIETKFGKKTYVVEVQATSGGEKDVIIDIKTGEVLAVE